MNKYEELARSIERIGTVTIDDAARLADELGGSGKTVRDINDNGGGAAIACTYLMALIAADLVAQ
jgi:hypothetical protein